ncbi:hypothetical protein A3C89_01605 [Candidatus Kaiserbacteria bacterium RIFCSPHIGHO2_02_FULL_50_50]|uniref:Type II secretion system protein GspG C-terminal domain-containing protein n=1 Tax=Candidatus Kaiserbacteria bacterium RIFCSPHIGHO2_02_FULL_50_50 TaxID=1798492 RepID=A0A1F6DCE0_9BACT|nr:MAG: hypothetical protein A3C89_01605 [Candidatus Kaiserbacteria bacterium RIFCSPHIGHO2_02_FULL_50_50]OGG88150.1 MAG: hypothetical protein A3G62_02640 [Candidatus Kaiserbacteria bacterium RIFCSPLOWO2_12_FULL_50_10]
MNISTARGFTLIELMVAITIIGILTAGATVAFSNARSRARDAQRYAVLAQIELALETYRQVNGSYPDSGGDWVSSCTLPTGYITGLAPTFLVKLPLDPVSVTGCRNGNEGYRYKSDGTDYKFQVYKTVEKEEKCDLETKAYWEPNSSDRPNTCSVYSAGGTAF